MIYRVACFSYADKWLALSSFFSYAEDYKLLSINSKDLQTGMNHLRKWCWNNNMGLNLSKCHNLIFKVGYTSHEIHIGDYELSEPDKQKDLGIMFFFKWCCKCVIIDLCLFANK